MTFKSNPETMPKKRGRKPKLKTEQVLKTEELPIEKPVVAPKVDECRKNIVIFTKKNMAHVDNTEVSESEFAKHLTTIKQVERLDNNSQTALYIDGKVLSTAVSDRDALKIIAKKIKKGGQATVFIPIGSSRRDMPPRVYTNASAKERLLDWVRASIKDVSIKSNAIVLKR